MTEELIYPHWANERSEDGLTFWLFLNSFAGDGDCEAEGADAGRREGPSQRSRLDGRRHSSRP